MRLPKSPPGDTAGGTDDSLSKSGKNAFAVTPDVAVINEWGEKKHCSFHPYISAIFAAMAESGRQLSAAFGAATGQDLAAVGSSHSLSETMNLGSVPLSGLIGTNSCHIRNTSC